MSRAMRFHVFRLVHTLFVDFLGLVSLFTIGVTSSAVGFACHTTWQGISLSTPPEELSGGYKRRLALAVQLVSPSRLPAAVGG
jgi:hypothetical protein